MKGVLMGPILKPTEVGAHLFRVKGELESILRTMLKLGRKENYNNKIIKNNFVN